MENQTKINLPIVEVGGVHAYVDAQGIAWLNAEDVARGLGFVQVKKDRVPTSGDNSPASGDNSSASGDTPYTAVRWERINKYLKEFGIEPVSKGDFIPEHVFYLLAMKANNVAARTFQWKVATEIMPSIRKTGSYSLVAPAAKSKPAKNPNRVAGQKSPACVYVFELIDGTVLIVKIGQSKDVNARKATIERKTKLAVKRTYKTSLLPRNIARVIERASHKFFSPFRLNGEFFSADYDTACRFLDALEDIVAEFPQVSYFDCAEKLLQIADKLEMLSENKIIEKSLLIKSAKLIADK